MPSERFYSWRKPRRTQHACASAALSTAALLAGLALHDKERDDADFVRRLPLGAQAADDDRNFVKKGVLWALNAIGRRSPAMHERTLSLCAELAARDEPSARWIGKTGLRELRKAKVRGASTGTKKRR